MITISQFSFMGLILLAGGLGLISGYMRGYSKGKRDGKKFL